MADNIFEMTRSLGQTRYTRFDETHDNENLVDQISETAAIGDAEGSGTEGSEACVKLLSVAEVAERLQVSQSLVYKMIERRQIPSHSESSRSPLRGQDGDRHRTSPEDHRQRGQDRRSRRRKHRRRGDPRRPRFEQRPLPASLGSPAAEQQLGRERAYGS